jgi:hypothetical protein
MSGDIFGPSGQSESFKPGDDENEFVYRAPTQEELQAIEMEK